MLVLWSILTTFSQARVYDEPGLVLQGEADVQHTAAWILNYST